MGFRLQGLGFGVYGLGFRVCGLGLDMVALTDNEDNIRVLSYSDYTTAGSRRSMNYPNNGDSRGRATGHDMETRRLW